MIRYIVAANVMSVLLVAPTSAEVPINSKQVRVSQFHYPTAPGKWASYDVLAIVENLNTGGIVKPKASLLPSLAVPDKGVTFVDQNGNDYVPTNCATRPARTISISVRVVSALPNEMQQVAVGAAFNGTNVEAFRSPWNTDPAGNPVT